MTPPTPNSVQRSNPESAENPRRFRGQSQNIRLAQRTTVSKRLSYRMESAERNTNFVLVSENRTKCVSPIISSCNDATQIHEIGVFNCVINRPVSRTIFCLTIVPAFSHVLRDSLLDPIRANQSSQMFPHYVSESSLDFAEHHPM